MVENNSMAKDEKQSLGSQTLGRFFKGGLSGLLSAALL
jgi:hypothetical protein